MGALGGVVAGIVVVMLITGLTAYFVAQEFGYMAVDRARLRAAAETGDVSARRALAVTGRTSFMLSGAQLGITVTGLIVGYLAEPMIGRGLTELLGLTGIPAGIGAAAGMLLALVVATVVQMVFGELVPKNLAIARPEPTARWLARSTSLYLAVFGPVVRVFDGASNLLLRLVRIEPVHDVEQAVTARDLEAIIDESRDSGDLPAHLSLLLDRMLDFGDRSAREAMIPRPRVATVPVDEPALRLLRRMGRAHSRYPVVGESVDDVLGVVVLRDVLYREVADLHGRTAGDLMRPALLMPDTVRLTDALQQLREAGEEFACVLDEYGGLAGILTVEDIAEELVGEITDEHDPAVADLASPGLASPGLAPSVPSLPSRGWVVPGSTHIDEVERLIDHDLPHGHYNTVGGLVIAVLGRLPDPGDAVLVDLSPPPGADEDDDAPRRLEITVQSVQRRVPETVRLRHVPAPVPSDAGNPEGE